MQLTKQANRNTDMLKQIAAALAGRARRLPALLAALAALVSAPLAAQGVTTGEIRGQVTDENGAPLGSVRVVARSPATGVERVAATGADGTYVLRLLPPGSYRVNASVAGRRAGEVPAVQVAVGSAPTVNFRLLPETIALEGLVVTAGPQAVETSEGGVKELVSTRQIEELPSLGRDFTDFINLSGLVVPDPANTTGGQFSIAGQRASQTSIQIDGVDANNAFFGENRGGSRIPFAFSLESIREFEIITNGFDVEYGNYSGGIINVATRGGTNDWDGTAYVNYRSDALTRGNFDDNVPLEDFSVTQFAGRVSGPILKDRLFFLFSLDGQRRREPQLPVTLSRYGPGGAEENPAVFGEVERFFGALGNQYGIGDADAGYQSFQTSNDVLTLFGRLDWNINDDHRLTLRHNFSNYENANEFNPNFDFIYGRSRAEQYEGQSNSFVTELQSILGPSTFNTFRFQYADENRPRTGNELRPALTVNLTDGERIGYGGTFAAFRNDLEETKFQVIDNFTHSVGNHTLKLGGNAIYTQIFNQFIANGAGEYTFASIEDFENFRPTSYRRTVRQAGGIPVSEFDVAEWSVYAQDEWSVTPRLTATLGLRYDRQSFLDDPLRVVEAERAFNVQSGIAPTDNDNFSPRLALAYDIAGDGSAVVRAGAGYFYGRVPYVLGGNVAGTISPVLQLSCSGEFGEPNAPPSPQNYGQWSPLGFDNPESCAQGGALSGVPSYTFWNEDFEFPETFKANVGYERALGRNTTISTDLLYTRSVNLYTVRNLNLREAQFTVDAEGGRRIFQPETVFDPTAADPTANSLRSRRNLEFGDVFVNYNDGRAEATTAVVDLNHRLGENGGVGVSYTYTRAFDNSSYSCCTASSGFEDPEVGIYGPNDVGGFGADDKAWGPSYYARTHSFVFTGRARLPFDIQVAGTWKLQSGRPWTPEVSGDVNGDGVRFNDRPYIYSYEDLPLAVTGAEAEIQRARYAELLAENECVGDHVGQIIPRNTCRFPWYNQLDLRVSKVIRTTRGQRAELQVDMFNVLNGLNSDWGRVVGVFSANRNVLRAAGYDAEKNQILYTVPTSFGREEALGAGLTLQFQTQVGLKYYF